MATLVKAHFLAAKYAVPHMRDSAGGNASIVNISSVHGLLMAPRKLIYEAGKSAVIGITKQMAIDFGPLGIRVNAICPRPHRNRAAARKLGQQPVRPALLPRPIPRPARRNPRRHSQRGSVPMLRRRLVHHRPRACSGRRPNHPAPRRLQRPPSPLPPRTPRNAAAVLTWLAMCDAMRRDV